MWSVSLQRALEQNSTLSSSKLLSLATVSPAGFPACRTLRCAEVVPSVGDALSTVLLLPADERSDVVSDLLALSRVQAAWTFPLTGDFFRLSGNALVVGAHPLDAAELNHFCQGADGSQLSEMRQRLWRELAMESKLTYYTTIAEVEVHLQDTPAASSPPRPQRAGAGSSTSSGGGGSDLDAYTPQAVSDTVPADNFVLIMVFVDHVEHVFSPPPPPYSAKPLHRESRPRPPRQPHRSTYTSPTISVARGASRIH
eukprot:gnl/Spiro4/12853_TR6808_c0_g1_i1.p1 gnl/Spiro4/12853_TR6808_c0_g1~~gnl/Spiro4/12853_TR6808_c0_g1_i1.p1  ORF type:complete len:264 (+),score=54.31 gnl/Spiro4/12853_TR6808_c0_g1_i1:30-794(+)